VHQLQQKINHDITIARILEEPHTEVAELHLTVKVSRIFLHRTERNETRNSSHNVKHRAKIRNKIKG